MAEIRKIEMSDLTARQLAQKITIHECFDEFFPWNDMKKNICRYVLKMIIVKKFFWVGIGIMTIWWVFSVKLKIIENMQVCDCVDGVEIYASNWKEMSYFRGGLKF